MARGSKASYTDKQKRQAKHIEEGYEKKGASKKKAERIAWSTVNKETGGGKKKASSRKTQSKTKKTTSKKKASGRK